MPAQHLAPSQSSLRPWPAARLPLQRQARVRQLCAAALPAWQAHAATPPVRGRATAAARSQPAASPQGLPRSAADLRGVSAAAVSLRGVLISNGGSTRSRRGTNLRLQMSKRLPHHPPSQTPLPAQAAPATLQRSAVHQPVPAGACWRWACSESAPCDRSRRWQPTAVPASVSASAAHAHRLALHASRALLLPLLGPAAWSRSQASWRRNRERQCPGRERGSTEGAAAATLSKLLRAAHQSDESPRGGQGAVSGASAAARARCAPHERSVLGRGQPARSSVLQDRQDQVRRFVSRHGHRRRHAPFRLRR